MKIDTKAFAERLRAALKHERIEASAAELVRLLELQGESVSPQAVSGWLNGKHRPRPAHMEVLARIVGLEPHELEYPIPSRKGVRESNLTWPDHVRGQDRLAFEEFLTLPDAQRKLMRELIAQLARTSARKRPA